MPLGQSKNPPAIALVVFKNSRRDSAKSFIAFSLPVVTNVFHRARDAASSITAATSFGLET
jgi:hypothetical protein